jgi:small subunit ribosomal protein S3e
MVNIISKKRKLVADGVFYAELNEFFTRELAEQGYAGCEVRVTPTKTEVIVRATQTNAVLGENGRRIFELTSLVQKRFRLAPGSIVLYAERVQDRGLSAVAQAESLKFKLLNGLAIRRAAYGVVRYVMESGAKGVEVVISGKLRAARAKAMKFQDGFLIHSGQPVNDFIDVATRHVLLRQGVLGVKVKIMRDPASSRVGPKSLPDYVKVIEPKEDEEVLEPTVKSYIAKPVEVAEAAPAEAATEA